MKEEILNKYATNLTQLAEQEILKCLRPKYEAHHNVKYTDKPLAVAVYLSYSIRDRFNPDKSIDLMDEAGGRFVLHENKASNDTRIVTENEIKYVASMRTGTPVVSTEESWKILQTRNAPLLNQPSTVTKQPEAVKPTLADEKLISTAEEFQKLLQMEEALKKRIIGQPEAVEAISHAVKRAGVGIRDPARPIASFLFAGLTGVGKTELANSLAVEYFGSKENMVRLDMSEYMERHTVSKLFGSPPGYIGSQEGGQLTEAVRCHPECLILFDEIEKAHPDVWNVLLQILGDGRLTDNKGQTVDFKNTIIIMTSNVGYNVFSTGCYLSYDEVKKQVGEALKKNFRPEFLNRIDDVIVFRNLTALEIKEIVEIILEKVKATVLKAKNINVQVTERFKEKLVEQGYDPNYGARPLRRSIRRLLEDKLVDNILNGAIQVGGSITVDVDSIGNVYLDVAS